MADRPRCQWRLLTLVAPTVLLVFVAASTCDAYIHVPLETTRRHRRAHHLHKDLASASILSSGETYPTVDVADKSKFHNSDRRFYLSNNERHHHPQVVAIAPTRRKMWERSAAHAMAIFMATATATTIPRSIPAAVASGGATAGRYTTIPIAKRRYYGRVQQGVHEFLLLAPVTGDRARVPSSEPETRSTFEAWRHFFDPQGTLIVPAKNQAIRGQCTKQDSSCQGKEIRDSRYNDMKASMYLLGNAFRTDQQKPPDRLPTVKAARAFFKEMDDLEKQVRATSLKYPASPIDWQALDVKYLAALQILEAYLDLVELPPTSSGHYDRDFDTMVGETARVT